MSDNQKTGTPIILLGMHRSGTSCLAGSLEEAGLYLGDVNKRAPYNAKGNRENRGLMNLNDTVLRANNASWDDPVDSVVWNSEHRKQRDQIIRTYSSPGTWGFKDPRTLLTLEGWLEAIPSARFVGTFRDPVAVATSLKSRNGFSMERGFSLWLKYNRLLLQYQRQFDFDLVCFDLPPDEYIEDLDRIASKLDLTPPKRGFSFFESRLRSTDSVESYDEPPESARETYGSLREVSRCRRT